MLENIFFFFLGEPAVFKPCADGHGISSWRALCCLYCAGKRTTTFFLGISVQHIPLRTGLNV